MRSVYKLMRILRAFIGSAACLVNIAMLLTFAAPLDHQFRSHCRTPQVLRTIERHTFVAPSESNAAGHIGRAEIGPVVVMPELQIQTFQQRLAYTSSYPTGNRCRASSTALSSAPRRQARQILSR